MNWKQKLAIKYIRARLRILNLVSPQKAAKKAFDLFCTPMRRTGKKMSPRGYKYEALSFQLQNHIVRGHRWLPHPSKALNKKVLITHGFESSSARYGYYIRALWELGYEVLAFDAPAHGRSGGRRITLPLYVDMIRSIVDRYGPVNSFMGHSLGALALSLYLESVPHDQHTRLALIAPVVEITAAVDTFFRVLDLDDELRTAFDAYELDRFGRPFSWFSLPRTLQNIKASILYYQDEDDTITPLKDALAIKAAGHPNIEFRITKGLGHRDIYKNTGVAKQVVLFL